MTVTTKAKVMLVQARLEEGYPYLQPCHPGAPGHVQGISLKLG